jgi:cell division protein FtsL
MKYIIPFIVLVLSVIYLEYFSYPRQKEIAEKFKQDTTYINEYMRNPKEDMFYTYLEKETELEAMYNDLMWLDRIDKIIYVIIFIIILYIRISELYE